MPKGAIPKIDENEMRKVVAHIFTIKDFKNTYLTSLNKWYQKDNSGEAQSEPKLGRRDGQSYDKTYMAIKNIVSEFSNENELLSSETLNKIIKALKKYKGRKSPDKLKYVQKILEYINTTDGYIEDMVRRKLKDPKLIQKMDKRAIAAAMGTLEKHQGV